MPHAPSDLLDRRHASIRTAMADATLDALVVVALPNITWLTNFVGSAERPELVEPMVEGLPYLRAEARHAARAEMATTLVDVLSRRSKNAMRSQTSAMPTCPPRVGAACRWHRSRRSNSAGSRASCGVTVGPCRPSATSPWIVTA